MLYISVWNSMISGYSHHGFGSEAIKIFETLCAEGLLPNTITFTSFLTACIHGHLPDKALEYVKLMQNQFGINPEIFHHNCVVDALARVGRLEESETYIRT